MIELLFLVFVLSQSVYAVVNVVGVLTVFPYRARLVRKETPDEYRQLNVLLPLYGESRDVVEETLDSIYEADYPTEQTAVYGVYETGDDVVSTYVDDLDLTPVPVKTDDRLWQQITGTLTARTPLTRNKARALTYALYTLDLEGAITVLDADTKFSPTLFSRGVAGLEEYDLVQAKQTVRNIDDGLLPLWESMGIAGWSHTVYAKTARGPYQLLGKGYFIDADTLYSLRGWNPADPTEDMALGIEAYTKGYTLGIVDEFIQDLCPESFWPWVRQKRRWVGGPYRAIRNADLTTRQALRFGAFTGVNQLLSLNHLFGVPAGAAVAYLTFAGSPLPFSPLVQAIVVFNAVVWIYYTVKTYQATRRAVTFSSRRQKVAYYVLSNPITQVIYATLWAVPILLYLFGRRSKRTEFAVTPKRVRERLPGETIRRLPRRARGTASEGTAGDEADVEGTPVTEPAGAAGSTDTASVTGGTTGSLAAFELYRDRADEWRWRLRHRNGEIIADSAESYRRRAGAIGGLESVRRTAGDAQTADLDKAGVERAALVGIDGACFALYRDTTGEWRWRLRHNNGEIIADSAEGYDRRIDAQNGIESVRTNVDDAYVVELPSSVGADDEASPTERVSEPTR